MYSISEQSQILQKKLQLSVVVYLSILVIFNCLSFFYQIEDVEWEDNLEADPHKFSGKSAQTESPSNLDLYRVFPDESKLQRIKEVLPVPTNDVRTAVSCIDVYQVNMHGEKFYGNQETLDMFPENKKSGLKKNGASLETGLMDCEWDEFGNFELFR